MEACRSNGIRMAKKDISPRYWMILLAQKVSKPDQADARRSMACQRFCDGWHSARIAKPSCACSPAQ
jgi:hypothetical protein